MVLTGVNNYLSWFKLEDVELKLKEVKKLCRRDKNLSGLLLHTPTLNSLDRLNEYKISLRNNFQSNISNPLQITHTYSFKFTLEMETKCSVLEIQGIATPNI